MKRSSLFIFAIMVVTLLGIYPTQTLRAQDAHLSDGTKSVIPKMTITGKIIKEPDGYYIQGETPPEVFTILNPIPSRLDNIVKSDKSVKLDVRIVQGDNVNIEKINGKPYYKKKKK